MRTWIETIKLRDKKKLRNVTNQSNQTAELSGRKSDEFELESAEVTQLGN